MSSGPSPLTVSALDAGRDED